MGMPIARRSHAQEAQRHCDNRGIGRRGGRSAGCACETTVQPAGRPVRGATYSAAYAESSPGGLAAGDDAVCRRSRRRRRDAARLHLRRARGSSPDGGSAGCARDEGPEGIPVEAVDRRAVPFGCDRLRPACDRRGAYRHARRRDGWALGRERPGRPSLGPGPGDCRVPLDARECHGARRCGCGHVA